MLQQDAAVDPRTARRLAIVQEQIAKVASVVRTMLDHARRPDTRWPTSVQRVARARRRRRPAEARRLAHHVDARCRRRSATGRSRQRGAGARDPEPGEQQPRCHAGRRHTGGPCAPSPTARSASTSPTRASGIAPELLPRIFDPWVTTKAAGRGTGLGLSITRDVIARHGGTITAESEPGRTTVTILLPPAASRPAQTPMAKILIVDDDGETCRFMAELLDEPDREIRHATQRADEALRLAREPFDLLISDINLDSPQNGMDVLRAFKTGEPVRTGRADQRLRHAADGDRSRARRRLRLHQQAVQHRGGEGDRRARACRRGSTRAVRTRPQHRRCLRPG